MQTNTQSESIYRWNTLTILTSFCLYPCLWIFFPTFQLKEIICLLSVHNSVSLLHVEWLPNKDVISAFCFWFVIKFWLLQTGQETDFILVSCTGSGIEPTRREQVLKAKKVLFHHIPYIRLIFQTLLFIPHVAIL